MTGGLVKAPISRYRWLTDICKWPERCGYRTVICDVLSYPELEQLRAGQRIHQVDVLSKFAGEINNHIQTFRPVTSMR